MGSRNFETGHETTWNAWPEPPTYPYPHPAVEMSQKRHRHYDSVTTTMERAMVVNVGTTPTDQE